MRILRRQPPGGKAAPLVASAARIKRSQIAKPGTKLAAAWQSECWDFYDSVGELRSGAGWMANSLSRVKLYVAEGDTDVPDPKRVDTGPAVDYLNALFNGPAGQAMMLAALGLHFTVPGDCYLVSYTDKDDGNVHWVTASTTEIGRKGTETVLDRGDGKPITLTDDDWILRMWQSHPRQWWQADSATRASLPVLRELEALGKRVNASVESRLAGNGILLLPQELTFPQAQNEDLHEDPLMATLIEGMVVPIQDRDSAAAVVPLVMQAPGEFLEKAKWLYPDSKLDAQIDPMRDKALRRLALGLDMPPEALLGMGGTNHWSAWLISEEGVKLYVEPKAATICDALTTGYLWPLLEDDGLAPDAFRDLTIWYDASQLTERPDRGPDADIVYDRNELSGDALRKYRGFSEDDKPSEEERRERILLRLADANPQLAPQILELLGVVQPGELQAPESPAAPQQIPSQRTDAPKEIESGDGRDLPDEPEDEAPAEDDGGQASAIAVIASATGQTVINECVIEVAHLATVQVLDWAGRRLLKRSRASFAQHLDVRPAELHTHIELTDTDLQYVFGERSTYRQHAQAWGTFGAAHPELVPIVPILDRYVRQLMLAKEPHCRAHLVTAFKQAARVIAHA